MDMEVCETGRGYITTNKARKNKILDKQEQQLHHATNAEGIYNCHSVLDLPMHLIYDILSRLPTNTIFNCKCVCKTFLNILTDPYFIKIHHMKPNYILLTQDMRCGSNLCADYNYTLVLESPYQTSLSVPSVVSRSKCELSLVVGECNGLLCLSYRTREDELLYICNPILGEFMALPFHNPSQFLCGMFGFCPKTKQYKVVRFGNPSICTIHTIGSDRWRTIINIPRPYAKSISCIDCCLHGNLHWTTETDNFSNLICSFNLESEKFVYISLPTNLDHDTLAGLYRQLRVGVLSGLLCICYLADHVRFEVYAMKEYGVKESWTKKCSIYLNIICRFHDKKCKHLINFSSNGDLFLRCHFKSIRCYNFRKETLTNVSVDKEFEWPSALAFVPSFISLKTLVATSRDIEIAQRKVARHF